MNNQEARAGLTVAICVPSGAGKSYITLFPKTIYINNVLESLK